MNSEEGKISFQLVLDDSGIKEGIDRSKRLFEQLNDNVSQECAQMDNAFKGVAQSVASLGMAWSLQEFGRKVADVRGEFQKLQVAMETMLQSKSKAEALMAQMVQTAATTPFGLQEVAGGAKQLLAYGLEAEKVNETLIRLGDIAAGLSIPLGDLVYLYGTTMTQGRLYTQDFNQFVGRGIPLTKELAAQFGVAEKEVKGLVEEGKVGFPEIQKVIENLTNEGGLFGGLMEKQSATISGQIANIEDAFDMMFNEIGQQNEGVINDALSATSYLVDNYQTVGDMLMTLVATYGVYKATLMAVTAYTNSAYAYEITQLKAVLAEKTSEIDADLAAAVSKGRLTAARAAEVQALRNELAAKIQAAQADAVVAQSEANEATRKRMLAQLAYQKAQAEVQAKDEEIFACEGLYATQTAETLQKEKDALVTQMLAAEEKLNAAAKVESAAKTKAATAAQTVNTLTTKRDTVAKKLNTTQTTLLTLCTNGLTKALKALRAAWATNPMGIILMGVTMVMGALMTLNDTMEDTSAEVERFGEAATKQLNSIDTLYAVINNTSEKSKVHKDAVDELCKIYEEYGIKIDEEKDKLEQLRDAHDEVTEAIKAEGEERQKANLIASYEEAITQSTEDMKTELQNALANAEWNGSGIIDDWDADEYQDRAKELATIIGSIIESEGDELAKLSGDEYEAKLKQINEKIKQAYKDLGLDIEKEFAMADGSLMKLGTDVDEIGIMEDYIDKIRGIVQHRQELIDSYDDSKNATEDETEAVNYEEMTFDELFKAAYKAKDKIAEVNNQQAKPLVSTSNIDNAIQQTETLLNNIAYLNGLGGYQYQLPQIPTMPDFKFNLGFNSPQIGFGINNQSSLGFHYQIPGGVDMNADAEQQKAQNELEKRVVNAMKTRKGVTDMLKDINDTAKAGSIDEKRLLALQKRLEAQRKKFQAAEGKGGKNKGETAAERAAKIEKAEQDAERVLEESAKARMEMERDLANQEEQNAINLEEDAAVRKRRQLELDQKKEREQLDKQQEAAIKAEVQRQKSYFDAQENIKAAKSKDYVKKNFTDADIDQTQINNIIAQYQKLHEQLEQQQAKATTDNVREESEAMREYLKEYGTYQQQKLAITEEYMQKIREATSEGQRLSLQAEMRQSLAELDTKSLKEDMDWENIFGNLDTLTREKLEEIKKQLRDMLSSGDIDVDGYKTAVEQIDKVNDAIIDNEEKERSFFSFATEHTKERKKLEMEVADAQARQADLLAKQQQAQADLIAKRQSLLDLLNGSGVDAKSDIGAADAQSTLSTVGKKYGTNSDVYKKVQKAFEELAQSEQDLNNVSKKRKQADNDVTNTTSKLNKFLNDFRESLSGFIEAFTQVNANIQELPGLFETLGVDMDSGFGQSVTNLANASNSALGAMTDFKSGNYIGALSKGISAFTSLGTAIFGGGDSDPHLAEDLERLSATNEALQYAIENLTEVMEDSSVADAADLYEQQKALLDESEANTQQSMQRSGAAYKNGFLGIGGKHSSNKKINDAMSSTEWSRISKIVGKDIDSAGDFWNLTSEEMRKIATDAPDLYAKIKQYADDGYANASQYMDDYIEYAKQREELEEAYYEKLTSYSFDNLRDEFKDFLTDSTMSWADACNNFNEMLVNSIAEALMTEKYDPMIKELYETWAKYMEDGVLDETEQADLQSRRDAIQNAMEQDRQFLGTLSTSATSQSSSSKGYATASQDSIDELNGRFTAVQMDTSAIRETLTEISASIAAQKVTATEVKANLAEIVNISLQALDYLQGIHKNTNELYTMNERLEKIEKNTRNL